MHVVGEQRVEIILLGQALTLTQIFRLNTSITQLSTTCSAGKGIEWFESGSRLNEITLLLNTLHEWSLDKKTDVMASCSGRFFLYEVLHI